MPTEREIEAAARALSRLHWNSERRWRQWRGSAIVALEAAEVVRNALQARQ